MDSLYVSVAKHVANSSCSDRDSQLELIARMCKQMGLDRDRVTQLVDEITEERLHWSYGQNLMKMNRKW